MLAARVREPQRLEYAARIAGMARMNCGMLQKVCQLPIEDHWER